VGYFFSIAAGKDKENLSFEDVFCFSCKRFVLGRPSFNSCCNIQFDTVVAISIVTTT